MANEAELLKIEKAEDWLQIRMPEIQRIIKALKEVPIEVVGDNIANLHRMHTVASFTRERQAYIKTYLVTVIDLELEVKRFNSLAKSKCKDAISKAFIDFSEIVEKSRSMEEKQLRLRPYVPEIKELEAWDDIIDQVKSLKEAVQLVYDDLSKTAMSISLQNNVVKNQILCGQIKVQFDRFIPGEVAKDLLMDSSSKVADRPLPGDGKAHGEFDFTT